MMRTNIHDLNGVNQLDTALEKATMKMDAEERMLKNYVYDLIRAEADKSDINFYRLHANCLNKIDQRIFLSYLLDEYLYDYFSQRYRLLDAACEEHIHEMQFYIDKYIEEVYLEDRFGNGYESLHDRNHGDVVISQRHFFDPSSLEI